jgi:serine/threonine protein kinase
LTKVTQVNFVGACWGRELTCLVLEWVSKGTLECFLDDKSSVLRWQDPLLKIASDIARGMSYLHGSKSNEANQKFDKPCILHRDLKSSNVLISEFLTAKIADFGTSAAMRDVTMTSLGTPLFAAPEIMRGLPQVLYN